MQDKGYLGPVRHVILFSCSFDQKFTCENSSCKLLSEIQSAYVSKLLPNFSLSLMLRIGMLLTKPYVFQFLTLP